MRTTRLLLIVTVMIMALAQGTDAAPAGIMDDSLKDKIGEMIAKAAGLS
nr:venom protein U-MPTX.11-Mc19 [Megalopyge crispata]